MKTCSHCGGGVAEPGEVTGWAGKWCRCWVENGQIRSTPQFGTPYDSTSVEEFMKRQRENRYKVPDEEIDKYMEHHFKDKVKKPSYSHILNLCEQLSKDELQALVGLLALMGDKK